jgi:ribosome-associated protein
MKSERKAVLDSLKNYCRLLDEKKAGDLTVLDVSKQSSITDYLILATATSMPHLRALRVELEKVIDASKTPILGMEAKEESGWMVIDTFEVMIHLFLAETRERYGLARLWRDATEISVSKLLVPSKPKAKTVRRVKPVPAKKRRTGR